MNLPKVPQILIAIVCLLAAPMLPAQVNAEKRAAIDELLRLTGMEKLMEQMKEQMLGAMKPQLPQAPPEFWTKFIAKMDVKEVLALMIPVYDKYYSFEDLRALNAFYGSPVGRKVLATLPQVMQEGMKIGQEWGERSGRRALEETIAELQAEEAQRSSPPAEPAPGTAAPRGK